MMRITTLKWVPPFAQGLVRDLRPRWALEESGMPYETKLISFDEAKSDNYRKLQPFGQVPVLDDGDLNLFESGAIVLHIAEKSKNLFPKDPTGRERAKTWVFAALNSLEQHISNLVLIDVFNSDKKWAIERRPEALNLVKDRLTKLDTWMNGRTYLEDQFTVGDLVMTTVLRNLRHCRLLEEEFPRLDDYRKRCEARPAFKKALGDQLRTFAENEPKK